MVSKSEYKEEAEEMTEVHQRVKNHMMMCLNHLCKESMRHQINNWTKNQSKEVEPNQKVHF